MTSSKRSLLLFTILSLLSAPTFSQTDSTSNDDLTDLFDDGGASTAKNLLKVMPTALLQGDLPFLFERVLTDKITLEAGAGPILPFYFGGFYDQISEADERLKSKRQDENDTASIGRSLYLQAKFYPKGNAPDLGYYAIQWRNRRFNFQNEDIIYTDFTMNYGFNLFLGDKWVFEYLTGIGYRTTSTIVEDSEGIRTKTNEGITGLSGQVNARIGFFF